MSDSSSASRGIVLGQIGQIALTVRDLPRAVAFYQDALGLSLLFTAPPQLAFFDAGGIRLMLTGPENGAAVGVGGTVLYFRVADLYAAHAELGRRGVAFVDEPHLIARMPDHDLWMAFFRDPDGHLIGLMAERPRAP